MNELVLANRAADWRRLKMLVLDSVSSQITKRVYNLGLDEFFEWFGREPRPGFTKATVSAISAHAGAARPSVRPGGSRRLHRTGKTPPVRGLYQGARETRGPKKNHLK